MNIKRIPPFVIFPDGFLANTKSENEFKVWIISQALWKRDDFKEDSIESVIQYYSPIEKLETFLETQFQFFLIRNSLNCQFSQNQFIDLIRSWLTSIAGKFPLNSFELILSLQSLNSKSTLSSQYGKYYYSYSSYIEYVRSWNNCTVDLITWKKFKFLSIPRDLSFLKPVFDKEGGLRFSETYMRKLFDEYVEDIYSSKFLLRLENKLIVEKDKYAIDKVLFNTGNEDDKKYLNQLCTNFYSWRILSTNLSKCLTELAP